MIAGLAGRIVMKIVDWILNKEKTRLCLQGATYANLSLLKDLFRNGRNTSHNFIFWKTLIGWAPSGSTCILGVGELVWAISLYPQKLHIKIYLIRGESLTVRHFFWVYKKLVFQLLKHSFWQIADFDQILEFEIDSKLNMILN